MSFIGFSYGTPIYIRASQQKGEFVMLIKRLLNNVNVPVVLSVSNACGSCASTRQLHKLRLLRQSFLHLHFISAVHT